MNWLLKKLKRHEDKLIVIPDHEAFMLDFAQLERQASNAKGLPAARCVTHRDFHLGNLLFGRKGKIYGIDFENKNQDDALRDIMSFLFDFAIKWPLRTTPITAFQSAATALWQGYADALTAPAVFAFFQQFSALSGWSGGRPQPDRSKQAAQIGAFAATGQNLPALPHALNCQTSQTTGPTLTPH